MYSINQHLEPAPGATYCPRCHSERITTKDIARKAAGTAGVVAGAVGGVAKAIQGARTGAVVCAFACPYGPFIGFIAGAILGGLAGGTTGGMIGLQIGTLIDEHVLHNHVCAECGHHFQANRHDAQSPFFTTIEGERYGT